jgi:hypothetical protein
VVGVTLGVVGVVLGVVGVTLGVVGVTLGVVGVVLGVVGVVLGTVGVTTGVVGEPGCSAVGAASPPPPQAVNRAALATTRPMDARRHKACAVCSEKSDWIVMLFLTKPD